MRKYLLQKIAVELCAVSYPFHHWFPERSHDAGHALQIAFEN